MGTIYLASNVMAPAGVEGMLCRVGCEFVYESTAATPAIAQVYVRPDGEHRIVAERCASDPELAVDEYVDAFGNRCGRLVIPEGPSTLRYDALVEVTGEADLVVPDADQCAPDALPPETILYLLPSRYCQSDRLLQVAWDLFGATEPGWSRVQAVCDWVAHQPDVHAWQRRSRGRCRGLPAAARRLSGLCPSRRDLLSRA
jgi:hypothetical protein